MPSGSVYVSMKPFTKSTREFRSCTHLMEYSSNFFKSPFGSIRSTYWLLLSVARFRNVGSFFQPTHDTFDGFTVKSAYLIHFFGNFSVFHYHFAVQSIGYRRAVVGIFHGVVEIFHLFLVTLRKSHCGVLPDLLPVLVYPLGITSDRTWREESYSTAHRQLYRRGKASVRDRPISLPIQNIPSRISAWFVFG